MNDFDDPELGRLLGRLAGGAPETEAAYGQLQGGIRRAQRRRAVAWSSTAAVTLLIGSAALAAPWRTDEGTKISAAGPTEADPGTSDISPSTVATTSPAPAATTPAPATTPVATTVVDPALTTGVPPTAAVATNPAPGTTRPASTVPAGSTAPTTAAPAATTTVPATTAAPAPSSGSTTCSSPQDVGFAVTLANGVLTKGAVTANGYRATTTESRADRIEIEFSHGSVRVKVRADAESGTIQCRSEVETEGSEESGSSVPGGDDEGGGSHDSGDADSSGDD